MNRKRPRGSSGVLAALLIAPRDFGYTFCAPCNRKLFYTYVGEKCPFCEAVVTAFTVGSLPELTSLTRIAGY